MLNVSYSKPTMKNCENHPDGLWRSAGQFGCQFGRPVATKTVWTAATGFFQCLRAVYAPMFREFDSHGCLIPMCFFGIFRKTLVEGCNPVIGHEISEFWTWPWFVPLICRSRGTNVAIFVGLSPPPEWLWMVKKSSTLYGWNAINHGMFTI